jgi:hypothetical protein
LIHSLLEIRSGEFKLEFDDEVPDDNEIVDDVLVQCPCLHKLILLPYSHMIIIHQGCRRQEEITILFLSI